MLRPINVVPENNLAVVGATCYGLNLIWPIELEMAAPFHPLLSPEREVMNGYLEDNVPGLYRSLFEFGSIQCAYKSNLADQFSYIYCEKILFSAILKYIDLHCKGREFRIHNEALLTIALPGSNEDELSMGKIRKIIRDGIKPSQNLLDQFANTFLVGRGCSFSFNDLLSSLTPQD